LHSPKLEIYTVGYNEVQVVFGEDKQIKNYFTVAVNDELESQTV